MSVRLVAESLKLERGGRQLLVDVDLTAEPGRVTAITGPSGSGKTALLLVLAGLDPPDAGRVSFFGAAGELATPTIGFVPQTMGLVPYLTAGENIAFPLQAMKLQPAAIDHCITEGLRGVGLEAAVDRIVVELSGGQRQRVSVARALALQPDVLIADEPTTELDAASRDVVLGLIRETASRGATVVMASHDPDVVAVCDSAYRLEEGGIHPVATMEPV